jgi:hypothetical protein
VRIRSRANRAISVGTLAPTIALKWGHPRVANEGTIVTAMDVIVEHHNRDLTAFNLGLGLASEWVQRVAYGRARTPTGIVTPCLWHKSKPTSPSRHRL